MAKRYDQMIDLVRAVRPARIVEIGVHRAMRARVMCGEAIGFGPVEYTGYDVFETMGSEFQEDALNGKGEPTEAYAREKLDAFSRKHPGFSYSLVIGDTRETLHGKSVEADFVFIDGDHRVDAVTGDYLALQHSAVVVFDDYYLPDADGNRPDIALYGANAIVERLIYEGANVEILPVGDACKHGGLSHLAVVRR